MKSARLEAFTDGVIAIIITIMVLNLRVPEGTSFSALRESAPLLIAYVLSYVNVGLYWNNHHHLLQATTRIDGKVLWANLFLLFWLSLVPFIIRWLGQASFAAAPMAAYGLVLGMASVGWTLLQRAIIACGGLPKKVAAAIGRDHKLKLTQICYLVAIPASFLRAEIAIALYVVAAAIWIIPDKRIESALVVPGADEESDR